MSDPFQDFDEERSSSPIQEKETPKPAESHSQNGTQGQGGSHRSYAEEIASEKIMAKYRTFFIDLKQSVNGKFVKISEKNNGRRSTIMIDAEDLPAVMEALQKIQQAI